ncbi:MAG: class I SAM-dependent methyltransferase [Pseudomonadota bacterium]|nr:class I SAM-dependent methyltransferase [Pseudomonadota bacterium]
MKRRVVHIASILAFCFVLFSCDSIPGKKTIPDVHFATTPHKVVKEMLKLAEVSRDDTVYDLGSGDGRIVIAAARDFGARGVGVELDKELIGESVKNAKEAGVTEKVKFLEEDFFTVDLHDATVVTLYLLPDLNARLLPKFLKELKPASKIVSHMWEMGKWKPDMTLKAYGTTVHLWVVPAWVDGNWRITLNKQTESRGYKLAIKQDFQKIRATLSDEKRRYNVEDTNIEGNDIAMTVSDAVRGRVFIINMEAVVKGDTMEGIAFVREGDTPFAEKYSMIGERIAQ